MTEPTARPLGVTLLAWLFILGGIAGVLFVLLWSGISGQIKQGLPLVEFAVVGFAIALGVSMLKGQAWAWYLGTFLWVNLGVGGAVFLVIYATGVQRSGMLGVQTGLALAYQALPTLIALLVSAYLFSQRPVEFFGVSRRTRGVALFAKPIAAVLLAWGLSSWIPFAEVTPQLDSSQLLQDLGDNSAKTDKDVQFMLERLANGNVPERISAAWALGQSSRADAVPGLLHAAREDADTNVRINAIAGLAALGGPEVEPDLVAFLDDADPGIQAAGLRGLADAKFAGAAERVGQLLVDNDDLRAAAVDALGRMGNPEGVPYLQQAARDPDEDIRTRVAFALGRIADSDGVPTLIELLQDDQWAVRANAAQALGMIGDPSARTALEGLHDDRNSSVRAASKEALERLP